LLKLKPKKYRPIYFARDEKCRYLMNVLSFR
jgi:hypothetical protein